MRKVHSKLLIITALWAVITPAYVHVADWPHGVPSYMGAGIMIAGWMLIIGNAKLLLRWMAELMMPGLLSIMDGVGDLLIWTSCMMRNIGNRLFTAGLRLRIVNRKRIRGEVI